MSGEVSYFKLGLFVLCGLALLIGGIIVFGAGALFQEKIAVETATTDSVQGLDVGAAVKYKGVTVGKVTSIDLAMWRYRTGDMAKDLDIGKYVLLDIALDREMLPARTTEQFRKNLAGAVEKGLRVRMASSGLTGPAYIEVVFVSPEENPPPKLLWAPTKPFIPAIPSVMTQIVSGVESLANTLKKIRIEELVNHADELLVSLNKTVTDAQVPMLRDKLAGLLDELNGSAARVKAILSNPEIDKTINNLSQTTASLKDVTGGEQVRTFVNDLPQISARLRASADRINEILNGPEVKQLLEGLGSTAENTAPAAIELRRLLRELNGLLANERQDIQLIITNLRQVLENAAALSEDAKNNPSRMIFGAPPPRITPGEQK